MGAVARHLTSTKFLDQSPTILIRAAAQNPSQNLLGGGVESRPEPMLVLFLADK